MRLMARELHLSLFELFFTDFLYRRSAIFGASINGRCVVAQGLPEGGLRRIILTASGGAFRDWPVERLKSVTVADAVKHPNWSMGRKITVDSASLMNKARRASHSCSGVCGIVLQCHGSVLGPADAENKSRKIQHLFCI